VKENKYKKPKIIGHSNKFEDSRRLFGHHNLKNQTGASIKVLNSSCNKMTIIINKPVEEVFEFTTNPKNTHLWISSIEEEISDKYPPEINTQYQNRGKNPDWDFYKVVEFQKNKVFTLTDLDENYFVKYTYRKLNDAQTELEYFEWVKTGNLDEPFTKPILIKLKSIMEDN